MTGPVGVVGLGVMGGSLVRRLSAMGASTVAWSPDPAERDAVAALPGASIGEPGQMAACRGIVLAVPLDALAPVLAELAPSLADEAWVQDVASLQGPALDAFAGASLDRRSVSAHPMAGAEGSGFEASRTDLYDGAVVWLSGDDAVEELRLEVHAFWDEVGARPRWVPAAEHDRRMAWVSHLPQLVSTELAALLMGRGLELSDLGPGALDMTRLAGSSPEMWRPLLGASPEMAAEALRAMARRLERRADALAEGDAAGFADLLAETRGWRTTA